MNMTIRQRAELRAKRAVRRVDMTVGIGSIVIALVYAALIYTGVV